MNRVWLIMREMESGDIKWDEKQYDMLQQHHDELTDLLDAVMFNGDGRIAWLTGKQIGLAKDCVAWASDVRANSLIAAGKTEYLQYC